MPTKITTFGTERRLCVQNGSPEPQEPMVGILKCSVMLHNRADFYLFALSKEQCECGNAGKCGHYHVSRNDFCFGIAQKLKMVMKRCHFEYALAVAQFERADLQHNAHGGGNNAYAHQQEEERGTAVNDHCGHCAAQCH